MTNGKEVEIDLDLDGKLLQVQVRSAEKTRTAVIKEFIGNAKERGIELRLAQGTKYSAIQLKAEGKLSAKWLVSLSIAARKVDEGSTRHYDFDGSDKFYEWLRSEAKIGKKTHKQKLWLVYDECSSTRGDVLYPLLKDIEREFRVLAIKLGIPLADSVRNRGTGEHLICNVETSELFGVLFMRPASQEYFLKQIKQAETDEAREQARQLTIADEIGFGEFKDFLAKLHTVRNPVMHGQYITEQDFVSAVAMLKKIKQQLEANELFERFVRNKELLQTVQEMLKSFDAVASVVQEAIIPTIKSMNLFAESIKPVTSVMRQFSGQNTATMQAVQSINEVVKNIAIPEFPKIVVPSMINLLSSTETHNSRNVNIVIKRAYDPAGDEDGYRVLVDRLWPRGIKKEMLLVNEWCKDIAPSVELRKWFAHDPAKFQEFKARYRGELSQSDVPRQLLARAKESAALTLIYAAGGNSGVNHAVVLRDYLESLQTFTQ